MIHIRDSTSEDVEILCGGRSTYTVIAKTIEKDGQPVAIAGVFIMPEHVIAFSDYRDCGVPKITMYRYSQQLMKFITALGLPAEVKEDKNNPNSGKFLQRMGFKFSRKMNDENWYRLGNGIKD